jgi:hypothetical protein
MRHFCYLWPASAALPTAEISPPNPCHLPCPVYLPVTAFTDNAPHAPPCPPCPPCPSPGYHLLLYLFSHMISGLVGGQSRDCRNHLIILSLGLSGLLGSHYLLFFCSPMSSVPASHGLHRQCLGHLTSGRAQPPLPPRAVAPQIPRRPPWLSPG